MESAKGKFKFGVYRCVRIADTPVGSGALTAPPRETCRFVVGIRFQNFLSDGRDQRFIGCGAVRAPLPTLGYQMLRVILKPAAKLQFANKKAETVGGTVSAGELFDRFQPVLTQMGGQLTGVGEGIGGGSHGRGGHMPLGC